MKRKFDWLTVLRSLFRALNLAGICVHEVDADSGLTATAENQTFEELLAAAVACDECWIYLRVPGESQRHTLYIVLGNSPAETVADSSVHPLLDATLSEWSGHWEGRECPMVEVNAPELPTIDAVLDDPCTSFSLKDSLRVALGRDVLDSLRDAHTLVALLERQYDQVVNQDLNIALSPNS